MALNTTKVLTGGLVAGAAISVVGYIVNGVILGDRMAAEANAFRPGMAALMMSSQAITIAIVSNFITGILLVWTYAAVRPRLGPGPRTAATVAGLFWVLGSIVAVGFLTSGMMSWSLWWETALFWLINLLIAAVIGGKLYSEDGGTTA
ncbi:MAG TPA: hypothetical protein VNC11_10375 [Gemmatimonadaceae bacterium]|jgi:hypothetical protein|nr:hypothetical protein [Gemmatimonadaceae bacterium]